MQVVKTVTPKTSHHKEKYFKKSFLINNLRYADVTTLMAESEELKSLLKKGKEESEKSWLKTQHSEN